MGQGEGMNHEGGRGRASLVSGVLSASVAVLCQPITSLATKCMIITIHVSSYGLINCQSFITL